MSTNVRAYFAGGFGVNIAKHFDFEGAAVIDTSLSNLRSVEISSLYTIEGIDGSGGVRATNHRKISSEIPSILKRFPAADFNIVVFSAGGGSGSVIGPLLISELLRRGESVVGVTIGCFESNIRVNNTRNTLKSLDVISSQTGQPVVLSYYEKHVSVTRRELDEQIITDIESLILLGSGQNDELDTKDISNLLNYQRACAVEPSLSALKIVRQRKLAEAVRQPIAIASLYRDTDREVPFGNALYNTAGFNDKLDTDVYFVINQIDIENALSSLSNRQVEIDDSVSTYKKRRSVTDIDDQSTEDGLVL